MGEVDTTARKRRRRADRQAQLAAANAARKAGDWKTAAAHLGAAVLARPDDHFLRMKQGLALLRSGDLSAAVGAFRQAIILKPERPEGHLELGRALRLIGQRDAALNSLSRAVSLSRAYVEARRELLILGGGDALPKDIPLMRHDANGFPAEAYAAFRAQCPIMPPPPGKGQDLPLSVLVDDEVGDPAATRATVLSLIEQSYPFWKAYVATSDVGVHHPLRSLAHVDPRIIFAEIDEIRQMASQTLYWLSLSSGTVLDREAVAWMAHAAAATEPAAAYADHELVSTDWKQGSQRLRPALHPMPDPDDLLSTPEPPTFVLLRAEYLNDLTSSAAGYSETRRYILACAMAKGRVAHVPRILSARESESRNTSPRPPSPSANAPHAPIDLLVIIPTRNGGSLLKTCVESLRKTATHPDHVRFLVIDNGSRDSGTLALLRRLGRHRRVEVLTIDEPFNWSRLNNLAVQHALSGDPVFVNDDTEMLTDGWDALVASHLARAEIGAVGARLLYPDGTVQHAGVALGVADGMPVHEGVHVERSDGGPLDRWRRPRSVAAVTGAFMAVRRQVFEAVGGFDAVNLAVAYNDIDLGMRVREQGLRILYEPALELVHHESVSRGRNDNHRKVAWDHGELTSLHRRWGDALFRDPARNPQWATDRLAPFDGFRDLPPHVVAQHIADSVAAPWVTAKASE